MRPEPATALDLWPALLANPSQAQETLAQAAVETIGPRAQAWADGIRATYPNATTEGLARLATLRFTRSAGLRAGLGAIAGPYAPVALLVAAAITQAELVLHLAAAYGRNATDPQRVAELVRLVPFEKRWLAGWAAVRLADRAWPGVSLAASVLGSRSAADSTAVRARRFYRESQSSQDSGSS
ncbi:hypothetical protein [Actinoplanes aureus]|uniref:Uncharacterized protein n=1 Tax=Actinoplanes aureus TaxID=2792083 RepID=A0A931C3M3_9ACTN|nr:hypothetical protein [Actinoplanes aureus]MBG0560762.1 hypothetical protein [Actinoplanes aureus]